MSTFSEQVLELTKRIPKGKVSTYSEVARFIGKPKACRAVGSALRKNKYPKEIPCHRVVKSDGSVGKYSGEMDKTKLLMSEGVEVVDGKIDLKRFGCVFSRKK